MKKVSVTLLETFRRFRDGASEWDTEQKVIDSLTETFQGNDYTNIGSACHFIIENAGNGTTVLKEPFFKMFGTTLSDTQIDLLCAHANELKPFVPEVKLTRKYNTKIGIISLTGVCDILKGNYIRDTKCKFSAPKLIEYYNSCQWKFYLSIFGLERFYYDIFEFVGYKVEIGRDVSGLQLVKHDPFECFAYSNMESDLQTIVDDFIEWIEFRGLTNYLKEL